MYQNSISENCFNEKILIVEGNLEKKTKVLQMVELRHILKVLKIVLVFSQIIWI